MRRQQPLAPDQRLELQGEAEEGNGVNESQAAQKQQSGQMILVFRRIQMSLQSRQKPL